MSSHCNDTVLLAVFYTSRYLLQYADGPTVSSIGCNPAPLAGENERHATSRPVFRVDGSQYHSGSTCARSLAAPSISSQTLVEDRAVSHCTPNVGVIAGTGARAVVTSESAKGRQTQAAFAE